jgi:hypothetical protein
MKEELRKLIPPLMLRVVVLVDISYVAKYGMERSIKLQT